MYYFDGPAGRISFKSKRAAVRNAGLLDPCPSVYSPSGVLVHRADTIPVPVSPELRLTKDNSIRRTTRIHRGMAAWLAERAIIEGRSSEYIIHSALVDYHARHASEPDLPIPG